MTSIVLIDDEIDAIYTLKRFLEQLCPHVTIVGEASSVAEGVFLILKQKPDLILLDISMQDGSGFDLLDQFPQANFQVIFTTGFDDFAIKAFKYNALDYLLKPINPDELVCAIEKIRSSREVDFNKKLKGLLQTVAHRRFNKVTLSTSEGLVFLEVDDIVLLNSEGNYVTVFTKEDEKYLTIKLLKEFEELLPKKNFCRTHQSHLVNLNYAKKYIREDGGYLLMINGYKAYVSRRRKEAVLQLLMQQNI